MKKIKVKYICPNCGALFATESEATKCCHGEEVFLCGRGERFHFDLADAKECAKAKRPLATCLKGAG